MAVAAEPEGVAVERDGVGAGDAVEGDGEPVVARSPRALAAPAAAVSPCCSRRDRSRQRCPAAIQQRCAPLRWRRAGSGRTSTTASAARPRARTSTGSRPATAIRHVVQAGAPTRQPPGTSNGSTTGPPGSSSASACTAAAGRTSGGRSAAASASMRRPTSPVSSRPARTSGSASERAQEADVGVHAEQHGVAERGVAARAAPRRAVGAPDDHLGEHRVVVAAHDPALDDARVHPHALGPAQPQDPPAGGQEARAPGPRRRSAPRRRARASRGVVLPNGSGSPAATRSCSSTRSAP